MESYRTEEEQVEALRKWWQDNSRSTFLAIALALGLGFGWQGWQQHSEEQAQQASALYDQMLEAYATEPSAVNAEEQLATARHLAETLKQDFTSSSYAQFAALYLARTAVDEGLLDAAETELRWVLSQSPELEMKLIAQLRLARVLSAAGDTDSALTILTAESDAGAFTPAYAEAEGDILLQTGDSDAALVAYSRAQSASTAQSPALALKLAALNPVPARDVTITEAVSVEIDAESGAVEATVIEVIEETVISDE